MSDKSAKNVQKRKALNVIITRRFIPVEDGEERWRYAISEILRIALKYMRENNIPIPGAAAEELTPGEPTPDPSLHPLQGADPLQGAETATAAATAVES